MLGKDVAEPALPIDAYVDLADLTLDLAEDIGRLAPFGNGNPPVRLATRDLEIVHLRTLGSRGDHLDLRVQDEHGVTRQVKWWFGDENALPQGRFDLAYTLRVSTFQGEREALIEWLDARPAAGVTWGIERGPAYEVRDFRQHPDPRTALAQMQQEYPDALLWAEGSKLPGSLNRDQLHPAQTLIVWTVPPDSGVWQAVLDFVQPQRLIVFGAQPIPALKDLLPIIAGMVKYAINRKDGQFTPEALAAATGQTPALVSLALHFLVLQAALDLSSLDWPMDPRLDLETAQARLQMAYQGTLAYRDYWMRQTFTSQK